MSLKHIEHFVVLMLENRSFDHLFGFRKGVEGLNGSEANTAPDFQPVQVGAGAAFEIPTKHALGPLHNVVDVNLQLFGNPDGPARPGQAPTMGGFAESYLQGFIQDVRRPPTQDELAVVMQSFSVGALPSITQ